MPFLNIVLCKFRCHLQCLAAPCCCDLDTLSLSDWESDLSQDQPPLSRGPGPRPGDAGRPGSCQFRPVDCQWEQCPAPQVPHAGGFAVVCCRVPRDTICHYLIMKVLILVLCNANCGTMLSGNRNLFKMKSHPAVFVFVSVSFTIFGMSKTCYHT